MDKIVIVIGPTAVGKTKLGVELAKEINGEIISMDSMQVYTELDILTNKVTTEEAQNIPHHLISEVDCEHQFNANQFVARAGIEDLEVSSIFLEVFSFLEWVLMESLKYIVLTIFFQAHFRAEDNSKKPHWTIERCTVDNCLWVILCDPCR